MRNDSAVTFDHGLKTNKILGAIVCINQNITYVDPISGKRVVKITGTLDRKTAEREGVNLQAVLPWEVTS